MDWQKLRAFNAAALAGSFTNAGALLNLSQSAVSRQITSLEQDLRTSLFHRHARGLRLTEQGEFLHGTVREMIARVSMAEARLTDMRDRPCGELKISTDAAFGAFWLAPLLQEFHELYPDVTLVLMLDGGGADLAMGEADVAICMSLPRRPYLVQRRILCVRSLAFAAPDYLRQHGVPRSPAELGAHRLVGLLGNEKCAEYSADWLLGLGADDDLPRRPIAKFSDVQVLLQAVSSGLGIGALPHFIHPEKVGLVRVLPDFASPKLDGYVAYPAELRDLKRITVFRDFLLRRIARENLLLDPSPGTREVFNGHLGAAGLVLDMQASQARPVALAPGPAGL